jgi:FkbM family methyltransferase
MEILGRTLRHPNPTELWFELLEIVGRRTYLQHGVEVSEGDVVLDVGANVGVAAAFFAVECRAGTVHSFEPVEPIFEVLRTNLRDLPACVTHPYGISSRSGPSQITYYPEDWAISGLYADPEADRATVRAAHHNLGIPEAESNDLLRDRFKTEALTCELRTLSEVLETESIDRVDLLKLDVEKSELDILEGIEDDDWPLIRQIAAEVHLDTDHSPRVVATLEERGFTVTLTQDPTLAGTEVHMLYAVRR